ncbi:MAG: SH3 domain-containing protein [Lachnospiraceae bacterium]|nr:SH3 domain-containing protein [Lachnospiraceae bacterium]
MKIRKNKWRCLGGKRWIVLAAALLLLWGNPIVSRAEAKGVVIPNSVNIRKIPEQGSEVIGSSTAGKEIDIRGQVESGGILWYQVYIDANTLGYVRADMIEKKGDGTIPTVTVSAENNGSQSEAQLTDGGGENGQETPSQTPAPEGGAKVEAQEAMDPQYATTNVQAKVRPDPSTSNPHVDSLTPGTQMVVSGKSVGSDSKTWYYVTFTGSNGSERTGYIRSDLLDLGEMLPMEEPPVEAPAEEPQEPDEPQVRNDYELKIETDSDGVATWYLYNNIKGEKEPLLPLLESMSSQSVDDEKGTGALVKQRIAIVVLSVLLVILAAAVVILAFKLRDSYYEDDDEDDEEDERKTARRESQERDERRTARRESAGREADGSRRTAGSEERAARRRAGEGEPRRREGQSRGTERQEGRRREREVTYEEDASAEAVRPASRRKTKNFLLDDDEFEFEFLNMDDKDLK